MADLTEAQHASLEEVATDALRLLEYAGFEFVHARYALIMEIASEIAVVHGGKYAVACLEKARREMQKATEELER